MKSEWQCQNVSRQVSPCRYIIASYLDFSLTTLPDTLAVKHTDLGMSKFDPVHFVPSSRKNGILIGMGCRRWVTDQLDLLHQAGLLTSGGQVAGTKARIRKLWPHQTPNPLDQAAYYE